MATFADFEIDCLRSRVKSGPDAKKLVELVKCRFCLNVAVPPIYSCGSGHNICSACHRGKGHVICRECHRGHRPCYPSACTLCNNQIFRNVIMEQVVGKCKFPCPHSAEGCDFVGNGYEMSTHSHICDQRLINCPKCKRLFKTEAFLKHIVETYDPPRQLLNSGPFTEDYQIDPLTGYIEREHCKWLKYENRDFFLRVEQGGGTNSIWMLLSLLGSDAEVEEWQTRISFVNKEKGLELSYVCPMTSIRTTAIVLRKKGHCMSIVPLVIKPFIKDNSITVKVEIISKSTKTRRIETKAPWKGAEIATCPLPKIQCAEAEHPESPCDTDDDDDEGGGVGRECDKEVGFHKGLDVTSLPFPDAEVHSPPVPETPGILSPIASVWNWLTKWRNGKA